VLEHDECGWHACLWFIHELSVVAGFLSMTLVPFLTGRVPDITIIPINISYDRTLEEVLFAYELLGVPKPKESTSVSCLVASCEIWGSDSGKYEGGCLLGCCTLMMEAADTSETSVNFCQTAWCNNPEDSHLHGCFLLQKLNSMHSPPVIMNTAF
jgi:hypothetical protein